MREEPNYSIMLVTSAAVFASDAHKHQMRKELNEPYIQHPLRVGKMAAQLGQSAEFVAAAYLHDVVEDTSVTMRQLEALFPVETMLLVGAMTKLWESSHPADIVSANKAAYYERILQTPGAALLKVLDRVDNLYDFAKMARLGAPKSHRWAAKYFEKTQTEFAPLLAKLDANVTTSAAHRDARRYYNTAMAALEVTL